MFDSRQPQQQRQPSKQQRAGLLAIVGSSKAARAAAAKASAAEAADLQQGGTDRRGREAEEAGDGEGRVPGNQVNGGNFGMCF